MDRSTLPPLGPWAARARPVASVVGGLWGLVGLGVLIWRLAMQNDEDLRVSLWLVVPWTGLLGVGILAAIVWGAGEIRRGWRSGASDGTNPRRGGRG